MLILTSGHSFHPFTWILFRPELTEPNVRSESSPRASMIISVVNILFRKKEGSTTLYLKCKQLSHRQWTCWQQAIIQQSGSIIIKTLSLQRKQMLNIYQRLYKTMCSSVHHLQQDIMKVKLEKQFAKSNFVIHTSVTDFC